MLHSLVMSNSWGIIALHGAMSHSGWFETLRDAMEERGVGFRALNRRGCGEDPIHHGYTDLGVWTQDVVDAVAEYKKRFQRVALLGWCWGGRLAIYTQSLFKCADCLVLAAPVLARTELINQRLSAINFDAYDSEQIPVPLDVTYFSNDNEVQQFIENDPFKRSTNSKAFFAASKELRLKVSDLALPDIPLYTILAKNDVIVDNEKVRAIVKGNELDEIDGGHALILECPDRIADMVKRFLERQK